MRPWMLVLLMAIVMVGCTSATTAEQGGATGRVHPLLNTIWLPAQGKSADWDVLTSLIDSARFVLAGEKHDNPDHHLVQARLVAVMARNGRQPALVWEMIPEGKRSALQQFQRAEGASAAGQGAALNWGETGWPDWKFYQPIADAAFRHGLRQYPGNLDSAVVRSVARQGFEALPDPTALALVKHAAWSSDDDDDLNRDLVDGHCGLMPDTMLSPMNRVQRSRDAYMAGALLEADLGDGAVLIAGNGHVRGDRGVPRYLAPETRVLSVGILEVVEGEFEPADYLEQPNQYDVVIFTDQVETPDRCEELKKRFGSHKK